MMRAIKLTRISLVGLLGCAAAPDASKLPDDTAVDSAPEGGPNAGVGAGTSTGHLQPPPDTDTGDPPDTDTGVDTGEPPPDPYHWELFSTHHDFACGVSAEEGNRCWGRTSVDGQQEMPDLPYRELSMGFYHGCGLLEDGTAICWGAEASSGAPGIDQGQADPPAGTFHGLTSGEWQSCALDEDEVITCWGAFVATFEPPTDTRALQVSAGADVYCALLEDHSITCWGALSRLHWPEGNDFIAVSAGWYHVCGLHEDGTVSCVGGADRAIGGPTSGSRFVSLASGPDVSCGVTTESTIECWYGNDNMYVVGIGRDFPTTSGWRELHIGDTCGAGLDNDGVLTTWGRHPEYNCPVPTP